MEIRQPDTLPEDAVIEDIPMTVSVCVCVCVWEEMFVCCSFLHFCFPLRFPECAGLQQGNYCTFRKHPVPEIMIQIILTYMVKIIQHYTGLIQVTLVVISAD